MGERERDPLRSGAIFRVQSEDYVALRSPVPRGTPGVLRVTRPIPWQGSTFGQTAMHPSPTEAGIMPSQTGMARGSFAGRTQQFGAPCIHEDALGTSGELRRGAKSLPNLAVSHPVGGARNVVRVPRFEVGGSSEATMFACVRASGNRDALDTTARFGLETAREEKVPGPAHHQEEIGRATSNAAVNVRLDSSNTCKPVAIRIDSSTKMSSDTTIGSNVNRHPSSEDFTVDARGESADSGDVWEERRESRQRQHLQPNSKQVSNTLQSAQLRRPQRETGGWQPIACRTLREKRGSQVQKADKCSLAFGGGVPTTRTKTFGAGEECQAPLLPSCSGARVNEGTVPRKRRRLPAATLEAVPVRPACDVRDLVATPASSRHGLTPSAEVQVTTTRSGRRSIPVQNFSQGPYCEGNKTEVALSASQRDVRVSDKRARTTRTGGSPNLSSAKSVARGMSKPRKRRSVAAAAGDVGEADDIPDKAIVAVEEPKASTGLVKTTRSGRHSAPVLDWWRSQRLSHAADGNVVVASGPSQDELYGRRLATPSKAVRPKSSGAKVRSPRCKTVKQDRDGEPSGKGTSWTQSQLNSLRVAQMGTAPRAKDFWGTVATKVEGRNPQECQQKWFEHFGSPKARHRKNGNSSTKLQKTSTPVAVNSWSFPEDVVKAGGGYAAQAEQPSKQDDSDDLFQATPMRARLGVGRRNFFKEAPPKTPAGPVANVDEDASTAKKDPRNGDLVYKPASATYVQAMSKKMRKTCGASNSGTTSLLMLEKNSISRRRQSRPAGRKVHAVTNARGRSLQASVSTSGAVNITSTGQKDDGDFEFGSSDSSDSEDY